MRRSIAWFMCVAGLGLAVPSAFGQTPYPYYGPMPMPQGYPMPMPMPQQGYPMPMPGYMPNPMMARPMYYPPAPMMPPQPMYAPQPMQKVFVLGPLDGPAYPPPKYLPAPSPSNATPGYPRPAPINLTQADAPTMPVLSKRDLPPEACADGDDCGDTCGPEGCGKIAWVFPVRGKGHFIGEIGAYFLVPFPSSRTAYNFANGANTGTSDFARQVDIGPRASVGYLTHTGWGARGNYWYLTGSTSQSAGNPAGSGTTIATPTDGPFTIVSPGSTLNQGVGVDQFRFKQRLELNVADAELLKQFSFLDTTFLTSLGGRYARINQSYTASRNNPGGITQTQAFALDREDLHSSSYFQGWGPTVSFEAVHPIACGFSIYGNARGSFLFGTDRFSQSYSQQNRTVTAAGAPTFTDISNSNTLYDTRVMSIFEAEAGIQFGCNRHRCFYFARAGVVYQRWWDVGSPTTSTGDLTFLGGTVRVGVAY